MENFKLLKIEDSLKNSLHKMNFTKPTPIQSMAIPAALEGKTVNLSSTTEMALGGSNYGQIDNPGYHMNPKSLDAKLIYAMFIPCLTFGAMVFVLLRSMARGYEFEMNKCYGCCLLYTSPSPRD